MADPLSQRGAGSAGRGFTIFLTVVIILALFGVVLYLLSDINSRRYRLAEHHGNLVVQKGSYLPTGFAVFVPEAEALKKAYEPLELPEGVHFNRSEEFDDRADLDRALFMVLASWARRGLGSEKPEALKKASEYVERCQMLPGLSEQQRIELNTLRADLAYRRGGQMVRSTVELLAEALGEYQLSKQLGTSRPTNADYWIGYIQQRLALFGGQMPAELPLVVQPQEPATSTAPLPSPFGALPVHPYTVPPQSPMPQPNQPLTAPPTPGVAPAPGLRGTPPPRTEPVFPGPQPLDPEGPEGIAEPGKWRL